MNPSMAMNPHDSSLERLTRLETIVGNEHRGLMAELESLKAAVNELKSFQLRIMGGFGVLAIAAQVGIQVLLK